MHEVEVIKTDKINKNRVKVQAIKENSVLKSRKSYWQTAYNLWFRVAYMVKFGQTCSYTKFYSYFMHLLTTYAIKVEQTTLATALLKFENVQVTKTATK